jgi:hypothetical protein
VNDHHQRRLNFGKKQNPLVVGGTAMTTVRAQGRSPKMGIFHPVSGFRSRPDEILLFVIIGGYDLVLLRSANEIPTSSLGGVPWKLRVRCSGARVYGLH